MSGGETLRALCGALGAGRLDLDGALLPGVPGSTLRGGAWDGVRVVSKSGAFGDPSLLRRLIRGDTPDADRAAPEPTRHGTPWPHRGERA
ncbi:nucleotide-binding domain containing protein [Azospirillum baldaniorum]|uniref:nucleotide-binding domain containing protein n=1 Tax=Azospirillum baldaniorum TaxID=1064539 RepID=UPI001FCC1CA0|nr:nucleotide-binding domain containing protein [Azospirillum baldaniorum]